MKSPLVSIIIPTYNRAHLIGETLDSVIAQTYTNWECIVVDDGSNDDTNEVLFDYCKKDSRFQYCHRPTERPKGANACRNYGLELSKGDYVLFFDSDDIIAEKMLSSCIEIYNNNLKVDFVFMNYETFNSVGTTKHQINKSINPLLDYFAGKINLATSSVLWKYETIKKNRFNESLKKTQELNFVFNVYKENKDRKLIGYFNNISSYFLRLHENSIVRSFRFKIPIFLFSDIYVRSELIQFFSKNEYPDVYIFNRNELERSLRYYLINSNNVDFFRILFKMYSPQRLILKSKIKLLFFKLIYIITKRSFRLNKEINKLYANEIFIKIK